MKERLPVSSPTISPNTQSELLFIGRIRRDVLAYAAFTFLLLLSALFCFSKLYNDDIFWQLATGRWIIQHHTIPSEDIFGYATLGQRWIPTEWLWAVVLYAVYMASQNYATLQIFAGILSVGIVAFQFFTMRRLRIATPIIILTILLLILTALGRFLPRAHLITALGLSVTVYCLYRYRSSDRAHIRILYILPVLFLFWSNMHPGVLVGLMLLGLAVFSESVHLLLVRYRQQVPVGEFTPPTIAQLKKFLVVIVLCFCAVLVNPHGIYTYLYVYQSAQMKFLDSIKEWISPFSPIATMKQLWFYKIMLILGLSTIHYAYKRRDFLPVIVYTAFALYSFQAIRLRVDFIIATAPGTALALHDLVTRIQRSSVQKLLIGIIPTVLFTGCLALIILLTSTGWLYQNFGLQNHIGFGLDSTAFPMPMLDFVKKEQIRGRPFNEFGIGGILLWQFPDMKNFFDSRDLNDSIGNEYISMYNMKPGFEKKFHDHGVDHVMIFIRGLRENADLITTSPIPYFSTHSDKWKLVFWDDESCLYVKNVPSFRHVIDQYEYRILHPYLFAYFPQTFDSLRQLYPEAFRREFHRKLEEEPRGSVIRFIAREAGIPL